MRFWKGRGVGEGGHSRGSGGRRVVKEVGKVRKHCFAISLLQGEGPVPLVMAIFSAKQATFRKLNRIRVNKQSR